MARNLNTQLGGSQTATEGASSGSQTILETQHIAPATLRLRGAQHTDQRHIQWAEDVIDNEGMGKKSSKVCCIYHKPHEPGDSDSDDSSDDTASDDEPDLSRAQRSGSGRKNDRKGRDNGDGKSKDSGRKPSPNAYERQPKHKHGQNGG